MSIGPLLQGSTSLAQARTSPGRKAADERLREAQGGKSFRGFNSPPAVIRLAGPPLPIATKAATSPAESETCSTCHKGSSTARSSASCSNAS